MPETEVQKDTGAVLAAMLTANTGTHMCDSGGIPKYDEEGRYAGSDCGYGRHYERNRHRDFAREPAAHLTFRWGIDVTHSVYHWLAERVEYDDEMQDRFLEFVEDREHTYWLEDMEDFPEWLRERGHEVTGLYGDGDPFTHNTYNGEDLLSQVLQFVYLEVDGEPYILLQIHNGCDVRGGYTAPKAFRVLDDGAGLFCNADAQIYCQPRPTDVPGQLGLDGQPVPPPERHYWQTDDACHWYRDGTCGYGADRQLERYERKEIEDPSQWEPDCLCVDPDGHGYCPVCGGLLSASF